MSNGKIVVVPAGSGQGIDPRKLNDEIVSMAKFGLPVTVKMDRSEVTPRFSNDAAQNLANSANAASANGVTIL